LGKPPFNIKEAKNKKNKNTIFSWRDLGIGCTLKRASKRALFDQNMTIFGRIMKLFPHLNLNISVSKTPYNFFAGNSLPMAL
jgi:hypothetical protein